MKHRKTLILMLALMIVAVSAATVSAASAPAKVKGLKATVSGEAVTLKWSKVKGAGGYQVYMDGRNIKSLKGLKFKASGLTEGSHSFKVRAYRKSGGKKIYGKFSAAKKVNIGSGSSDSGTLSYRTHPEITLSYGNATVYLGQAWTEDVHNKLKAGSSGETVIVRKGFDNLHVGSKSKTGLDQSIYMIDTGDYDNFLAVYVSNGQIVRWIRNSGTFGKDGSKVLKIGDIINIKEKTYKCGSVKSGNIISYWDNYSVNSWDDAQRRRNMVRYDLPDDCILMGGFTLNSESDGFYFGANKLPARTPDKDIEKQVMLQIMNAIRGTHGSAPLQYSDWLDGTGKSFTGTVAGQSYTNQIFGAQAWAESMDASDALSHNNEDWGYGPVDKGPLGGSSGTRGKAEECLTALLMFKLNLGYGWLTENVGRAETTTGEKFVCQYYDSAGHYRQIILSDHTHVGIGISGRYHCEEFGGPDGL